MRASEFIFELTNPSDPPPRPGDEEFSKSAEYFAKIISNTVYDFNEELKFLYQNNRPVYDTKITDLEKLRLELANSIIDEIMKRGAGNFLPNNKALFASRLRLNDASAPFNPANQSFLVQNTAIELLAIDITTTWYTNRHTRFTNSRLYNKMQGQDTTKISIKVMPIEDSVARELIKYIGVGTNNSNFWNKLSDALGIERKRNKILEILNKVYDKTGYTPTDPVKVLPLDANAAKEFEPLLGITRVDDLDFWHEFAKKIEKTPDKVIRIFNTYYP